MSSPSEWIAAIDIGGSKIAVTLADASGPRYRLIQPTVKTGTSRAIPEQCHTLLQSLCHQADIHFSMINSIGVSACGPFAFQDNFLGLVAPNLCGGLSNADDLPNDWTFIPLASVLQEQSSHVVIDNDCIAALTAERNFGAAQDEPNCAYVTWSTGIGFGLCVDGHVLRGKHGNAGHAGHMLLSEVSDALCGCGNQGDLEGLISGRNLSQRLQQPLEVIFTAAAHGDPTCLAIAEEAAKWLGRGLYNLITTLDLRCILMGGSVWRHHAGLLAPLVEKEIQFRFPAMTEGVVLQSAALGELVADLGALSLVMPESWKADWNARQPWNALSTSTQKVICE
jgi:glucokinase